MNACSFFILPKQNVSTDKRPNAHQQQQQPKNCKVFPFSEKLRYIDTANRIGRRWNQIKMVSNMTNRSRWNGRCLVLSGIKKGSFSLSLYWCLWASLRSNKAWRMLSHFINREAVPWEVAYMTVICCLCAVYVRY